MHRRPARDSYNSFRRRNGKTARANVAGTRRGGIRL